HLGGDPADGRARGPRHPDRARAGRRHHRVPEELRQRLHQALAAHPGRRLHRRDPLRAQRYSRRPPRPPPMTSNPLLSPLGRGQGEGPRGDGPPALRLDNVCRSFGGLQAVDGVTLEVRPGERRALIGPNGAGKTTLFNLISGAMPVTSGSIRLFGRDVTGVAPHRRAALGLARTFQITNLFRTLTVLENCLLAVQALESTKFVMLRPLRRYHGLAVRAQEALAAVGLGDRAGRE